MDVVEGGILLSYNELSALLSSAEVLDNDQRLPEEISSQLNDTIDNFPLPAATVTEHIVITQEAAQALKRAALNLGRLTIDEFSARYSAQHDYLTKRLQEMRSPEEEVQPGECFEVVQRFLLLLEAKFGQTIQLEPPKQTLV